MNFHVDFEQTYSHYTFFFPLEKENFTYLLDWMLPNWNGRRTCFFFLWMGKSVLSLFVHVNSSSEIFGNLDVVEWLSPTSINMASGDINGFACIT